MWKSPAPKFAMPRSGMSPSSSRGFSVLASSDIGELHLQGAGVQFGDLLNWLDVQYGLASRFVQEPLSELASILGYVKVTADTIIEFGDAGILMEEIGVPPITPDQLE